MHKIILSLLIVSLAGCGAAGPKRDTYDAINAEIAKDSELPKIREEVRALCRRFPVHG